ncbi:TPA: hypothetical protein ACH3X3_004739 [Trebouxia sp. C0006]
MALLFLSPLSIFAADFIGLMVLAAAKAFSASSVAITDIRPGNLPLALQLGAAHALDQSRAKSTAETVESFRAVFPKGPDIVIDCEGLSSTLTTAMEAVAPGGTVVQVGLGEDRCCIPAMQAVLQQFPLCLSLLAEGKIQTEPLITHRFGFSQPDSLKGFETAAAAAKTGAIKVMFSW